MGVGGERYLRCSAMELMDFILMACPAGLETASPKGPQRYSQSSGDHGKL